MKKQAFIALILSMVVVLSLTLLVGRSSGQTAFKARLSGAESVPPVMTKASGTAQLQIAKGSDTLTYKLTVTDIPNVTAAHIHFGKKGQNGPPVAFLFSGPAKEGPFSGMLAAGVITAKDLFGPLKGKGLSDLIKQIRSGDMYINVHTKDHPDGEIRGQITQGP